MKVGIYDLEYNSFTQVSARKIVPAGTRGSISVADPKDSTKTISYENIGGYIKRSLDNRFALVHRAMVAAFAKHPPTEFDVSFFTAPEFFRNVPWGDFLNEVELQVSTNIYLTTVTANVRTLISKFPASQYGKIVLLPGTVAALKPNPGALTPNGDFAATTKMIYEAQNQLVCAHNLALDDKAHPRPAYMIWPKRVVSAIDFKDEAGGPSCVYGFGNSDFDLMPNPVDLSVPNFTQACSIHPDLNIIIAFVTSSVGQSFDSNGKLLSKTFQNDIVDGLPFGIDICLDYAQASVQKDQSRMSQLDERKFKLDFLLSAGMSLSPDNYAATPYIQYAIHNDGILSSNETSTADLSTLDWDTIDFDTFDWSTLSTKLYSNVVKINYDAQKNTVSLEKLSALDADSPFDDKKGLIAVDETANYVAPRDANATGIPNILDPMNPANVRIWSLNVDISDTSSGSDTIIASSSPPAKSTPGNAVQIVN